MAEKFSKSELSYDGVWASVSSWNEENSKLTKEEQEEQKKSEWDKLNETIFEGLDAEDMPKITAIMDLKKAGGEKREYWTIVTFVLRLLVVDWHSELRQYSWKGLSNPDGKFWRKVHGEPYYMKRLAIHLPALEDFKKEKKGESDGTLFKRISSEQLKLRDDSVDLNL